MKSKSKTHAARSTPKPQPKIQPVASSQAVPPSGDAKTACVEIRRLLSSAAHDLMAAARLVVYTLDHHCLLPKDIAKEVGASIQFIRSLERCGRGELLPELVYSGSMGRNSLARLALEDQRRYLKTPVPVVTPKGSAVLVPVDDLTAPACRQVFIGSHVRSVAEQREWLKSQKKEEEAQVKRPPFEVVGRLLRVNEAPQMFDEEQLVAILAQIRRGR